MIESDGNRMFWGGVGVNIG